MSHLGGALSPGMQGQQGAGSFLYFHDFGAVNSGVEAARLPLALGTEAIVLAGKGALSAWFCFWVTEIPQGEFQTPSSGFPPPHLLSLETSARAASQLHGRFQPSPPAG